MLWARIQDQVLRAKANMVILLEKKAGKNWSLSVFKYLNDGQIKSPRETDIFF